MNALYLLDVYTESTIINKQLDQHSHVILGLTLFLTSHSKNGFIYLHILHQTSICSSILKITVSNFQEMALKRLDFAEATLARFSLT